MDAEPRRDEPSCQCYECGRELGEREPAVRTFLDAGDDPEDWVHVIYCIEHAPPDLQDRECFEETACQNCGRAVFFDTVLSIAYPPVCCDACEADEFVCFMCGDPLQASRSDAIYCSNACRQAAYRMRKAEGIHL